MGGILAFMIGFPLILIFLVFVFFGLIFTFGFYMLRFLAAKTRRLASMQENMQYQGKEVIDIGEHKNRKTMFIIGLIIAAIFFILMNFLIIDNDGNLHWKNKKQEIREGQYVKLQCQAASISVGVLRRFIGVRIISIGRRLIRSPSDKCPVEDKILYFKIIVSA